MKKLLLFCGLEMPKLAQILEQPNNTQQVCLFFLYSEYLYKTKRFHFAHVGLFSNGARSQRTSK